MSISAYKNIYFIGIGGIGMSALARYFKSQGYTIAGYDKTNTKLTKELINEGIEICFDDTLEQIPNSYKQKQDTIIIYTPAIPSDSIQLNFFKKEQFSIYKRAEILGEITKISKGIGVAGTHGKTTTSSMLAHVLYQSHLKCAAFLGGISSNYNSNYIANPASEYTVIEADEFDRSFLKLKPYAAIITSTDADHLDIYGNADHVLEGFQLYADLVDPNGFTMIKKGLNLTIKNEFKTYAVNETADISGNNLKYENATLFFDINFEDKTWDKVELGLPGIHNAENALACVGMCLHLGLNEKQIRDGLASFKGVKRRFDIHLKGEKFVYIDDYAHHPTEITAFLSSVKQLYPTKKCTVIFQPHLFSRTRDFLEDFAKALSLVDDVIILPIYPARELPIEGVTSERLLSLITAYNKQVLSFDETLNYINKLNEGVVLTIGAGDIDTLIDPIINLLENKLN